MRPVANIKKTMKLNWLILCIQISLKVFYRAVSKNKERYRQDNMDISNNQKNEKHYRE